MQNNYMSVNQFLQTWFKAVEQNNKFRVFANMIHDQINTPSPAKIKDYVLDWRGKLTPEENALFNDLSQALENNSPEAKDFLNIAKTFTFFTTDAWRNKYSNSEFVARNLLQAVQNNIISNPIYAYKLLKEIPRESVSTELYKDIVLEIANNPNANANDAAKYARFLKTPKEIREMITDWLNRADEALKPELDKDIKDFDAIQAIRNSYANGIGNMFGPLGDLTRTDPQEFAKTKELETMLDEEFDINKMIKVKSGNYIQQYKERAEVELAELKPEMDKMRQDLASQRDFEHQQNAELEKAREEIEKMKQQLQQKDVALQNTESKYNMLKGQVNLYIRDVKERANGSMFGKGKDLADLAMQLQSQINQSK